MKRNFSEEEIQTAVTEWAKENPETVRAIVSNPEILNAVPETKSNVFIQWIKDHPIMFGALVGAVGLGTTGAIGAKKTMNMMDKVAGDFYGNGLEKLITKNLLGNDFQNVWGMVEKAAAPAAAVNSGLVGAAIGAGGGAIANTFINKNFSSTEAEALDKNENITPKQQKDINKPALESHNFSTKKAVVSTKGLTRLLGDKYIR